MKIYRHKNFKKKYCKLSAKRKQAVDDVLHIFFSDPFDARLNNHSVDPPFSDCRSINVTGDMRAIYYAQDNLAVFINVDTHANLYG